MSGRALGDALAGGLGLLLAASLPMSRSAPEPVPPWVEPSRIAVPDALPHHERFAEPSDTDCPVDPNLEAQLGELRHALDEERAFQRLRWGEPTTPPLDWDRESDELRIRALLADMPDRQWSTVDCTFYPCVGLLVTSSLPGDLRTELGVPDAVINVGSHGSGTFVAGIAFQETPTDDPLARRWGESLILRMRHHHVHDLDVISQGGELAE